VDPIRLFRAVPAPEARREGGAMDPLTIAVAHELLPALFALKLKPGKYLLLSLLIDHS
jgi:hypothetical protein